MYYRLSSAYALRGWKNASVMLIRRPENNARPLAACQFSVLVLCDGQTPLIEELLLAEERMALQQFVDRGVVTVHDTPLPLDAWQLYTCYENRFIQSAMWSVTGMCNYRCRHCFVDGPCREGHGLSTADALEMIDQMAACGVMQVELTGGEPLLRPDFLQLLDRLCARGIFVSQIYTNGALVDAAFLQQLKERQMHPRFCFSFDGTAGWHDWMRGVAGAEEKTLQAMRLCVDAGYEVYAGMCLHKGNVSALPDTVKCLADLGVQGLNISGITMSPLWEKHHQGYAMNDREYLEAAMAYFPLYFRAGRPMPVLFNGVAFLHPDEACRTVHGKKDTCGDESGRYLCGTARFAPYISPEGRLLPCMPISMCREQEHFPLILEKGLAACLTDSALMTFISRKTEDLYACNNVCGGCEYRQACGGGCRANALRECQDALGCDPYQCLIWKEGYREKIISALEAAQCAVKEDTDA